MKIALYADNTLPLDLPVLAKRLNDVVGQPVFYAGEKRFRLTSSVVSYPESYSALDESLREEMRKFDIALLATNIPYDNNFFFESDGESNFIISFWGWNFLTDLPISNGLVYFVAGIIADHFNIGFQHKEHNTGCVNDFLGDKTGVDLGMRSAFLCRSCQDATNSNVEVTRNAVSIVESLLDLVSEASRRHREIESIPTPAIDDSDSFDVFLCHNSEDKPQIRKVNNALVNEGVKAWLDEEQIEPGMVWQQVLEEEIDNVRGVAVFVGESGIGPWQGAEIRAFLSAFHERGCLVVPVILEDALAVPDLPLFLRQMMWVDMRRGFETGITHLVSVIKKTRRRHQAR